MNVSFCLIILNTVDRVIFARFNFREMDKFNNLTKILYTSESDVCRHQILPYKDDPRTDRIKIFLMLVDP